MKISETENEPKLFLQGGGGAGAIAACQFYCDTSQNEDINIGGRAGSVSQKSNRVLHACDAVNRQPLLFQSIVRSRRRRSTSGEITSPAGFQSLPRNTQIIRLHAGHHIYLRLCKTRWWIRQEAEVPQVRWLSSATLPLWLGINKKSSK